MIMKKIIIWLLALAGGLIALLVAAVIIIPTFIDVESYRPKIEQKVSEATGRPFSLGQDFDVSVFPWAGVSFNDLKMGNPEQFGSGEFVKVKSFEARVKLLPLLSKKIEIDKFVLDGPEIELVKLEDGAVNWRFAREGEQAPDETSAAKKGSGSDQESAGSGLQLASLEVDEFAVTNGTVIYIDKTSGQTRKIEGITFRLTDLSLDRPVNLFFQALVEGKAITVEGSVGPIGKVPGEGTIAMDLGISAMDQVKLKIDGELIEPAKEQKFNLNLSLESFSPRALSQALEIPFPIETADPSALTTVALDFHVQGDPTAITVSDSRITVDESNVTIGAEVKDMNKPDVSFRLNLNKINIDRYLPPPAEKKNGMDGSGATADAGQPNTGAVPAAEPVPINYEPLRKLIINGEIRVGELVAHGAKVSNVEINMAGKDGVFDINPFRLALYQGAVNVLANFNVQGDEPVAKIKLDADRIKAGPLLRDTMKKDILEGTMGAAADITFRGATAPAIKKSLNGPGELKFINGAIVGIDIADMARSLAAGAGYEKPKEKPRTDFAELQVPFILENGVFQTQDTGLRSPLLRVNVAGTADLVTEKLNMKVRPKIVGTLKGQGDSSQRSGLTVPIRVEGTFAKPEYSADLSGIADEETLKEAIKDPEATKEKLKSLEESGKGLLKSFGFGSKK